jgi:predicted DNA binding CopG/RHH family protein
MKYDKEEKEILEAYESGVMKLSKPSKKEIEAIKAAAKNSFKKDRRITIRLFDHDFKGIQKNALRIVHHVIIQELERKKNIQR